MTAEPEELRDEGERHLRESEERFRSAFDDAGLGMSLLTRDGRNLRVNRAMSAILGYTEDELLHLTWKDIVHPDDLDATLQYWDGFDAGVFRAVTSQKRYFHKDGHPVWVEVTVSMVRGDDTQPRCFLAQVRDITTERTLTDALRESEERFRSAFEDSAVGMAILSPTGETLRVNAALARMVGHDLTSVDTMHWTSLIHPDDHAEVGGRLMRIVTGELVDARAERRFLHRDGTVLDVSITSSAVRDSAGAVSAIFVQIDDISERTRLDRARKESEERLELVLEATRDGIWDWHMDTGLGYFGPQWFGMLGYPAVGRWEPDSIFRELIHPDDRDEVWAANRRQVEDPDAPDYDQTFRMRRADGSWAWIRSRGRIIARDASGHATRMLGTHADVTERRVLEEQFRHTQKMEAVGKLAGGVAHDFNNLLTTISATTQAVREELSADDPHRTDLDQIVLATDRAKALTGKLLAFSRLEVEQRQQLALDQAVCRVEPLLRRLLAPGQELAVMLGAHDALVSLDPAQLELALLNLVANARDAMPGGGTVTIRTAQPQPDEVTLTVADTGLGMEPAIAERAFEPFFTTKPQGKGTGLGLATVYGFAERLGGGVTLQTAPAAGTAVTLTIPVSSDAGATSTISPASTPLPRHPGRRVLVVDDEPAVRRSTRRLLERRGYVVFEAESAAEALTLLEGTAVDVMLTDHAMPGGTGRELVTRVIERHPQTRVVLMSGFAGEGEVRDEIRGRVVPFLPKPFTLEELVAVLDAGD